MQTPSSLVMAAIGSETHEITNCEQRMENSSLSSIRKTGKMRATSLLQLNQSQRLKWHSWSATLGKIATKQATPTPRCHPMLLLRSQHANQTSGLICAPITPDIAKRLALPQMVSENADPKGTAYTVTIDSSDDSVTTGISAQDRALTCRTLASPSAQIDSFRRPGHIIPLQARPGGVRERPGHTEAAVEFCRLAGKPQVGVIAELVEDGVTTLGSAEIGGDNGMMRRDQCLEFGKKWNIKVCTIEDLREHVEHMENGKQ